MNNYPNQPPQLPPGNYNPFNPYSSYDPNADYVSWLPGRQGPRFLPIVIVVAVVLLCSCCAFFTGTIFGIELPGMLGADSKPPAQDNAPQDQPPQDNQPTPESFNYHVTYRLNS